MDAIVLTLDRTGRQALDEITLDEQEEEAGRNERHDARRHHLPEVHLEFRNEGEKADREGRRVIAIDQHQREQ
jgi:hypothetical protein